MQSTQALIQRKAPKDNIHPDLRWRIFEALMARAQPVQDRYACGGQARTDGEHHRPMDCGGPAMRGFVRTGRYHREGGLRHVPGIAGSAASQAPPIP
jgi:hypothetical protein